MPFDAEQHLRRPPVVVPLCAAAALAILIAADESIVRLHLSINWSGSLNALEHFGSAWGNFILTTAALVISLLSDRVSLRHLIVALPLQAVVVHLLKWSAGRVRPCDAADALLFDPFSPIHDSWPSGHASLAWTIALVFVIRRSRAASIWVAAAHFICWARLHTGAHFPSDLFAGAMVGWIAARGAGDATAEWISTGDRQALRAVRALQWRQWALWCAALMAPMVAALALGSRVAPVSAEAARAEVAALYRSYLGREADAPGLEAYAAQRIAGLPLLAVARDILDSDESRRRLALIEPRERIAVIYDLLLHRAPTAEEVSRDTPLVENLTRRRSGLTLLILRLTWQRAAEC